MAACTSFDSWILAVLQEVATDVCFSVRCSRDGVVERSHNVLRYIEECSSPAYRRRWRGNGLRCVSCIGQLDVCDLEGEVLFVVDSMRVTQLADDQSRVFGAVREYCISSICVRCQSRLFCERLKD